MKIIKEGLSDPAKQYIKFSTVFILSLVILIVHYQTQAELIEWHSFYFHISYIPIILAGFWFGFWGGLIFSVLFIFLLLPQLLFVHAYSISETPTQYLEFVIYVIVGSGIGLLSSGQKREKKRYQQTAEKLTKSLELLEKQNIKLQQLQEFISNVLNSLSIGVLSLDSSGKVIYINKRAEELLRHFGDLFNQPLFEKIPVLAELKVADSDSNLREVRIPRAGGGWLLAEVTILPLMGADGKNRGQIVLISDISRRKQLEQDLIQAEKLAAVGALAAGIAHEVKNPLQSIRGTAQILATEIRLTDRKKKLIQAMIEEIDRLNELVNNFLLFARPRPPIFIEGDLNHLIEKTLEFYKTQENTRPVFRFTPDPNLPAARFDPEQIKQVLLNLIQNAIEAGGEGNPVTIVTRKENHFVVIDICDKGPGIPESECNKIFTPFYSTKATGTGLGLAISSNIMKTHGGQIKFENLPDGGCRFSIFLSVVNSANSAKRD